MGAAQLRLEMPPLAELQQRRSEKWSGYAPGVISATIAEMDFPKIHRGRLAGVPTVPPGASVHRAAAGQILHRSDGCLDLDALAATFAASARREPRPAGPAVDRETACRQLGTPPQAGYLAWLDFRDLGLVDDPATALLERARVALSPGLDYGASGAGWARLNFGTDPELLTEMIDRIAVAVSERAPDERRTSGRGN